METPILCHSSKVNLQWDAVYLFHENGDQDQAQKKTRHSNVSQTASQSWIQFFQWNQNKNRVYCNYMTMFNLEFLGVSPSKRITRQSCGFLTSRALILVAPDGDHARPSGSRFSLAPHLFGGYRYPQMRGSRNWCTPKWMVFFSWKVWKVEKIERMTFWVHPFQETSRY